MSFSAAHRLYSNTLTDQENLELYGKCINDHGHNYRLIVCIRGNPDPTTGMFLNLTELKKNLTDMIVNKLDHAHLNTLPEFNNKVPTLEELIVWIWEVLEEKYGEMLHEIQLFETNYTFAKMTAGD
ncbi:MAG: 6-carboxytetrahydropterin synthase [Bacillota bacterium]